MLKKNRMSFKDFFFPLLFQLLLFSQNAFLQPVFNSQPLNPSSVLEGQNLNLQWSYNVGGKSILGFRISNVTGGTEVNVASRSGNNNASVEAGYENQFRATISDTDATLTILAVPRTLDEEKYELAIVFGDFSSLQSDEVKISVLFKPENVQLITNITANNTCPGGYWNFTCSVGAANPQVTSYQLLENDIAVDTSSSGMWIRTLSNSGVFTYKCLANNTVGSTTSANEKKITVAKRASVVRIVNSSDTVIEGNSFNVVCNASDELIVFWIKEDTDQRINGSVLNFTSINRNDSGTYRCEAENDCGSDSRVEIISVSYKPDSVELKVNTTENTNCSDLRVNFTCVASEANPAVYNFVLYEKNVEISRSKSGMWIKKISKGGKHVYSCIALHAVGHVTSLNNVTLTVNVSASVNQIENKTFVEGDSVFLYCNATGFRPPFVVWSKTGGGVISQDRWLNITNITKADRGQYQCFANNTCGSDVKVTSINVQFKPENVNLTANVTTKETCLGWIVKFTCTADANPAVDKYSLYENDTIVDMDVSGVWIRPLNKSNHVVYRCEANNSLGNKKSNSILFIVGVPASVNQIGNETVVEGDSVSLNCKAMGSSAPFVAWSKVGVGVVSLDRWLNITNITKEDRGQYKCFANNTCGSDVSFTSINVQYTPKNTLLTANVTSNETCLGWIVKFTCIADANPVVNKYYLYEDDTIVDMDVSGVWIRPLNKSRHVIYRCEANNSLGSGINNSITLIVGVPAFVNQIDNETVVEGESASLKCNAMGFPAPVVAWSKIGVGVIGQDRWLNITSITKADMGHYQCFANNTCGIDVKVTSIKVQYPPNITYISANMTVNQSDSVNLTYRADGNPKPAITWSKDGKIINSSFTVGGKSYEGLYVCNASNGIGNASIKSVFITVEYFGPFNTALTKRVNTVRLNTTFNLNCSAQANPPASYRFSRGQESLGSISVGNTFETYVVERTSQLKYSCTPFNHFGDGQTVMIQVEVYYSPQVTESNKIFPVSQGNRTALKCPVDGNPPPSVQWYKGNGTSGKPFRTGETLEFSNVTSNDGGVYTCLANNTVATVTATVFLQVEPPKPLAVTTATEESTSTPSKSSDKGGPRWFIIGGAIGAAVLVIIIIVVAWWVHKKRKCRKDTKIHNSESQVLHGENDIEDGVHAKVNGGYADAGPQSANGTNLFVQPPPEQQQQQAAAAPPAYAVVDKSKKKKKDKKNGNENIPDYAVVDKSKKKKKKAEVEDPYAEVEDPRQDKKTADPATHDYAIVDKSKKKKKEADESAYATVDKSKKSKKQKPKAPGEVLYADLDDFKPVQAPSMPTVSTSPEPLAPLKRPTPYQGTEYADITQFLKGNATLPEGQSTEMQPTYANAGGGQEAANKENANTGGEGGGGDTEPKETPM